MSTFEQQFARDLFNSTKSKPFSKRDFFSEAPFAKAAMGLDVPDMTASQDPAQAAAQIVGGKLTQLSQNRAGGASLRQGARPTPQANINNLGGMNLPGGDSKK